MTSQQTPPWKLQRQFEAFCQQHQIAGVALLMEPTPPHKSAPITECTYSAGGDKHRNKEFVAAMLTATHQALRTVRPDTREDP